MNAIVLAAGIGTRLQPVTDHTPKALVFFNGSPLLYYLLQKLRASGYKRIIVNAHHHAQMMIDFIHYYNQQHNCNIELSIEDRLLDTGGGIKKMLTILNEEIPVLVHNVDILSDLDFNEFYATHVQSGADATLAIQKRTTTRPLLFDPNGNLCGRKDPNSGEFRLVAKPLGKISGRAFCGIQIIKPEIFLSQAPDRFYSIDAYMKSAARGMVIKGINISENHWKDLGTMKDIEQAEIEYNNDIFGN